LGTISNKTTWDSYFNQRKNMLNKEQESAFDRIQEAINNPSNKNRLHFIYGEGGTGKTFLYQVLISGCKANDKHVIVTASTGIASTLLTCGRTVHATFLIPNDVNSESRPNLAR
jgi:ATP-dependent DNA helicase PIF1